MSAQRGYAPLDIIRDSELAEARFDLVGTRVEVGWGSAYARHRHIRESDVATVFLHGASGCWTGFTPLLQTARDEGIRIPDPVLIDLPGWGDGVLAEATVGITIDQIVSLVLTVLDTLGYARAQVVGHSMGGLIALHLAATEPARVTSVGIVSATSFAIIESVEHPFRAITLVPAFSMLWKVMGALGALRSAGVALLAAATRIGLMRVIFGPLFRHGRRVPDSVILATVDGIDPRAFLTAAEVVRGYGATEIWSRIRCPVRAIAGDHDVFVGDDDLATLQRVVPQARITIIGECGHFALVEWPDRTLSGLGFVRPAGAGAADA